MSKRKPAAPKPSPEDVAAALAADTYLRAAHALKVGEKEKSDAKCALITWLGDKPSRVLFDGRTVNRATVDFAPATIERKGYTATTLTIAPPPAA